MRTPDDDDCIDLRPTIRAEGSVDIELTAEQYAKWVNAVCDPIVGTIFGGPLDGLAVRFENR